MRSGPDLEFDSAELDDIERDHCASLSGFAKRAWRVLEPAASLKWGWALDLMCEHLEAVTRGEITRLLINVPPGMMKSLLVSVIWPAWEWGPVGRPETRIMSTAHSANLAIRDSTKCRRLIQSEWYQGLWPVRLTSDQNAKTKFENDRTGFREAMAFESMTGSRGDRVILDDPHSVGDAASMVKLASGVQTFREALPSRVNNDRSAIVIIMQRLAQRDVSAVAVELGYSHLCLPMEYEHGRSKWVVGNGDPRTKTDELLFPERFSASDVAQLKKSLMEYATAGQLQQNPIPRGGGAFKAEALEYIDQAPDGVRWVRGWDLASTTDGARTAGVKMGLAPSGRIIVGHVSMGQWRSDERDRKILAAAQADNCPISIPQDPGQAGKSQVLGFTRLLHGHLLHTSPETGDKSIRAEGFAAQVNNGNVDIVRGDWNTAFVDELEAFPNGRFMDQVDASSRAYDYITTRYLGGMYKPAQTLDKIPITLYELTIRVNGAAYALFGRRLEDNRIIVIDGGYWDTTPLDGVQAYLRKIDNSALPTERMAAVVVDGDDTLAKVIKDQVQANDWIMSVRKTPTYKDWLERAKECEVLMQEVSFLPATRLGDGAQVLAEYTAANREGTQPRHDLLDLLVWETLTRLGGVGLAQWVR